MMVKISSALVPWRGNSWYFESPKERVYVVLTNPTTAELEKAIQFANEQYEQMGWMRCFVAPPAITTL